MPLTPADVHNVAFSKPPIGKRGYNEDEVDAFLDLVESELARLVEENNNLLQRLQEFDGAGSVVTPVAVVEAAVVEAAVVEADAPTPKPVDIAVVAANSADAATEHNLRMVKVLALAQEMADRLTGEARGESELLTSTAKASSTKMVTEATASSERMLSDARSKSEAMTLDARTKADSTLVDARTRAETLQRQAKEKVDTLQAEAERKHVELMGSINAQRTQLEKKVDELRTFEREYRTRLKTYLESQLQELGQRGSASPVEATRAATAAGLGGRTEQGS